MDGGWGEKLPVCGVCLTSGKWRELLPPEPEPEPEEEPAVEPAPEATESTQSVVEEAVKEELPPPAPK